MGNRCCVTDGEDGEYLDPAPEPMPGEAPRVRKVTGGNHGEALDLASEPVLGAAPRVRGERAAQLSMVPAGDVSEDNAGDGAGVVPKQPESPLARREYAVQLKRESGQAVGLMLSQKESIEGVVEEIRDGGMVAAWNDAGEGSLVQVDDRLISVNGIRGRFADLLTALRDTTCAELELVFKRPKEFSVEIRKESDELGLTLMKPKEQHFLPITAVKSTGKVHALNSQYSDRAVRVGDCIIEVEGVRGSVRELSELIKESADGMLKIRLIRW